MRRGRGVFIDTSLFVAVHNTRDVDHDRAIEIIKDVTSGDHGHVFTSDYVFDEAVTTALVRTKRLENATRLGEMILNLVDKRFIEMVRVDEHTFNSAWSLFQRLGAAGLSFTDCTSLAAMSARKSETIASFDSHFQGLANVIR